MKRTISIIRNTIVVPAANLDPLYEALQDAAADGLAPYNYEHADTLQWHLYYFWDWDAHLKQGDLCDLTPNRADVDTDYLERVLRIFAPYVQPAAPDPCEFAFRDTQTGEFFRYLLRPGEAGASPQFVAQQGYLHWAVNPPPTPPLGLAEIIETIAGELGGVEYLRTVPPGHILASCLTAADGFEQIYHEANHRADHEDADRVDTQYMEDELIYPLKQAAKLRALAIVLLLNQKPPV